MFAAKELDSFCPPDIIINNSVFRHGFDLASVTAGIIIKLRLDGALTFLPGANVTLTGSVVTAI